MPNRIEYLRRWRELNRSKIRAYGRKRYALNKEKIRKEKLILHFKNRSHRLKTMREWKTRNAEHVKRYKARYRMNNNDKIRAYQRRKRKELMTSSVAFVIRERLRKRITEALRNQRGSKSKKTMQFLGCSLEDFRIYIESKFDVGMNWSNWGKGKDKWNLDHIVPCAIFDLTKPEHQNRCFHFSNYQPLWQPDNSKKRANSCGQLRLI